MKQRPVLISIFSILSYICVGILGLFALLFLIIGIMGLFNPIQIENISGQELPAYASIFQANTSGWFFLIMFTVFLVLSLVAVLGFFIGRGLWKGQNWTRILGIIFCGLGIIQALVLIFYGKIFNGPFNLIWSLLLGGYLLFNKNVKKFFLDRK
jgi:hypothetical protein